jgi:hypothetical protein
VHHRGAGPCVLVLTISKASRQRNALLRATERDGGSAPIVPCAKSAPATTNRRCVFSCYMRGLSGGRTRARTWDPMIKSHLLYQLSYAPGTGSGKAFTRGRRLAKRFPDVQQGNEISRGCFPLEIQPNFPQPPPRLRAAGPRGPNRGAGAGHRRRSTSPRRSGQTKSRRKPAAFQLSIRQKSG